MYNDHIKPNSDEIFGSAENEDIETPLPIDRQYIVYSLMGIFAIFIMISYVYSKFIVKNDLYSYASLIKAGIRKSE